MLVAVRLTPLEARALDNLVELFGYKSRSDAIREALGMLFHAQDIKPEALRAIRLERMGHTARRRRKAPE